MEMWLIWSNEHNAWWKPAHNGYTRKRDEAGRYPHGEAQLIVRMANRYHQKEFFPFEAMVPEDLEGYPK